MAQKRLRIFAGPNGSGKSSMLRLLNDALKICYKSYLFDNSEKMIPVARINRDGRIELQVDVKNLPGWFIENVANKTIAF